MVVNIGGEGKKEVGMACPRIEDSKIHSGRAGGRERGAGRGPGRGRGVQPRHPPRKTTVFKGNTDAMNGHVFQCQKETQDKSAYLKTVEALGEYISKTLDYPRDITGLCKNFTVPVLTEPADLS